MEQLIQRLNLMPNSYYEFVDSMVDYAKSKESHFRLLMDFLDKNETATPSDVIKFISFQSDFFDDNAPMDENVLVGKKNNFLHWRKSDANCL